MNAAIAREIIAQALEDETTELESVPEDDKDAIAEAERLVQMANDAWKQNIQGPEVEAILNIAKKAENDEENDVPTKPKPKPKPAAKAAPKGRPTRKADPEPEVEEAPEDPRAQEEPWDGYDSDKVSDVVEGLEVWAEDGDTESIRHVLLYETAHKNRKKIVDLATASLGEEAGDADEEEAASEPEETAEEETVAEEEAQSTEETGEPYEGYDGLKMSEVIESLEEYLADDETDDEDKLFTLRSVFDYEALNKTRTRLLDWLDEKSAELGFTKETVASADQPEEAPAEEPKAAKKAAKANGKLVVTREQILTALENGSVEIG